MKKWLFFVMAVAVVSVLFAGPLYSADETDEQVKYKFVNVDEKARFQLFNAEYNSAMIQTSQTTKFNEKKLFKIDTKTGETWMLIDVFKDGRDIKYWKKIKETPDN
ncbi:MAG: hypothetical protein ABIK98_16105 [Pseudomonadota bacterium]